MEEEKLSYYQRNKDKYRVWAKAYRNRVKGLKEPERVKRALHKPKRVHLHTKFSQQQVDKERKWLLSLKLNDGYKEVYQVLSYWAGTTKSLLSWGYPAHTVMEVYYFNSYKEAAHTIVKRLQSRGPLGMRMAEKLRYYADLQILNMPAYPPRKRLLN